MKVYLIILSILLAINAMGTLWAMWRISVVLEVFQATGDLMDEVERTRSTVQKLLNSLAPPFRGCSVGSDHPTHPINLAANVLRDWKS